MIVLVATACSRLRERAVFDSPATVFFTFQR